MSGYSLYDDELTTGEYFPQATAYYFRQWDGFEMAFHRHDAVEIMYVISGKCTVDTVDRKLQMKKGDFILLDSNVAHRLIVEPHTPCRMINIEFVFIAKPGALPSMKVLAADNRAIALLLSTQKPYFILKDPNEVYHTLKNLLLELDDRDTENGIMVDLLFSQLLIRIARLVAEAGEVGLQQANIYVKKIVEYLHHHYDCDIQVKHISSAVNLHPGYLHRIFKASMGCTVMEYLTMLRMDKAKMLLAHTDMPVNEISSSIGLNSSQYFSSIFKKHSGQTPLEFRKSVEKSKS